MEKSFIRDLMTLVKPKHEDRATLAALRRGLGKPPGMAGEMHAFVIPRLPELPAHPGWIWEEKCYFIVASLFAWHPENIAAGRSWERSFGASARALKSALKIGPNEPDRIATRLVALLNANSEDLPEYLRSMVGLFRAHSIAIDWEQLLRDLRWWDDPERAVQTKWAKAYWAPLREEIEADGISEEADVTAD